jgi:putative nucleotidyltransferase with HDIG domain
VEEGECRTATTVLVPLRLPEGVAGYLAAGREDPEPFSQTDLAHAHQVGEHLSVALANASLVEEIERISWGALTALARAIDANSPWTLGHSERVASVAVSLGRGMGLQEASLQILKRSGLVHDIGKIAIPRNILEKDGPLTAEERELVKSHCEEGVRILEPIPAMEDILPSVLHHHEAWDGSGYPFGLAGETIPVEARVLATADHFDAFISDRPYREGMEVARALELLREQSGRDLDPEVVDTFFALFEAGDLPLALPRPVGSASDPGESKP